MGVMTVGRSSEMLTRADLDAMPDDGRRYELLDGAIVVTPSPGFRHQTIVGELYLLLRAACPSDLVVLLAPFDVVLGTHTVVVPDLVVAPRTAFTAKDLPVAPLLAIEVLSPSTRRRDLGDKRGHYQDAGVRSYWVVDPLGPRLLAWELRDGEYEQVAEVGGAQSWTAAAPFPVTLRPDLLLAEG